MAKGNLAAVRGIMIDRAGTPDRDDAIWAQAADGGWDVSVHVALVADAVRRGDGGDQRAARQAQSIYLPDRTIPMLPRGAEAVATLSADRERPALEVAFHVADDGTAGGERITVTRLRHPVAMDYAEATAAITDQGHPQHEALAAGYDAARALLGRRRDAGALAIYDLTRGWASDGDGALRQLAAAERHASYVIIAEFMVAANVIIAGYCVDHGIAAMFRNHDAAQAAPPREQLVGDLRLAASGAGEEWQRANARQRLLHLLRPAEYSVHATGHFGLRLPWYCHATSPLRRYADLVTQRQLVAALRGEEAPHPATEVGQLATVVNEVIRQRRERRAERGKEATERQRRAELTAGGYEDLAPDQFHRLLKLAVKEGLHSRELEAELARRAGTDALLARDPYPVLMSAAPEWAASRAVLMGWLARHPEHAVSLAAIHASNLVTVPLWEDGHAGSVRDPLFSARAGLQLDQADGAVTWSPARVARRKDTARQLAALSLIAILAGQPDPSPASPDLVQALTATAPEDGGEGRSPVTALYEMCQVGALLDLDFAYAQAGPSHDPKFTCTATARHASSGLAFDSEASASSKKDAKTAAARRLCDAIAEAAPAD